MKKGLTKCLLIGGCILFIFAGLTACTDNGYNNGTERSTAENAPSAAEIAGNGPDDEVQEYEYQVEVDEDGDSGEAEFGYSFSVDAD